MIITDIFGYLISYKDSKVLRKAEEYRINVSVLSFNAVVLGTAMAWDGCKIYM